MEEEEQRRRNTIEYRDRGRGVQVVSGSDRNKMEGKSGGSGARGRGRSDKMRDVPSSWANSTSFRERWKRQTGCQQARE